MGKTWKDKGKNRRWGNDYESYDPYNKNSMKQDAKRFRQVRSSKRTVDDSNENDE